MSGSLVIVGLGPGRADLVTPAACEAIAQATDLVGYDAYLRRIGEQRRGQRRHPSGNRVEAERARHALELAGAGRRVVVVSSGDPGIFAMAASVFEAVELGPPSWRGLDIRVEPGVTAMLAAAAEAGAPLGGDFCAISLSDNQKSWTIIARRLRSACEGDFVIALYNPASKARPHQLGQALDILRAHKGGATIVVLARAAGTGEAMRTTTTLAALDPSAADMRTLLLVGSSATRAIARAGKAPWIYTPRRALEIPS
jgi:precorrin-3B C17-methyltransferase